MIAGRSAHATDNKVTLGLTASGGVSLGAYQAGYLFYLTEFIKQNSETLDLKVLTGASAGGLNSFVTLLSVCAPPTVDPQQSLFWKVWIPLNLSDLGKEGPENEGKAFFSRAAFASGLREVEIAWRAGLPVGCSRSVGIAVSRLKPTSEPFFAGLTRQVERFVLQINGRGMGVPPEVSNAPLPSQGVGQPLLALEGRPQHDFERIKELLYASSAFPLAFAPQKLSYCMTDPQLPRWQNASRPVTCQPHEIKQDEFLDGGILDNKPLALAHRMIQHLGVSASTLFMYFDLASQSYPVRPRTQNATSAPPRLLPFLGDVLKNSLEAPRRQEIFKLMEDAPHLRSQILAISNDYPRASDNVFGFFGFFDRQLREFDFYLGMYEARLLIERKVMMQVRVNGHPIGSKLHFPEGLRQGATWAPFYCLQSHLQNIPALAPTCLDPSSVNMQILLQTSLDRLYAYCKRGEVNATHSHICQRAAAGETPPRILANGGDGFEFRPGESDFRHTLRRLEQYGFEFNDLGIGTASPDHVLVRVKTQAIRLSDQVSARQPAGDRAFFSLLDRPLLDLYEYAPTETYSYFVLGNSLELGQSRLDARLERIPTSWRLSYAIQLKGLETALSSRETAWAATPLIGPEWEWIQSQSRVLQPRLAIRAGYQLSDQTDLFPEDWVLQASASVTLLERLRAQLTFESLPWSPDAPKEWSVLMGLGLQF